MNKRLQTILDQLQKSESLTPEEKRSLTDALKESDKEFSIAEFKLERTEKVKRTTAILLEETIAELEEKRRAVEAQNRELEIEMSLERVRARAMGMHHSDELSEVLSVLFAQFDVLGITPVYTFLSLIDLDKNTFDYRQTGKGGARVIAKQVIDLNAMVEWKEFFENMRAGKIEPINCLHFPKESLGKVWEVFGEIYSALPEGSKVYPEDFPDGAYTTQGYCKFGYIGFDHSRAATEEEKGILLRFAKEFERTYTRFLDLQKAEAQAREAQIEAALERVRSRSIAMRESSELGDLSFELVKQVQALGIATWHCAFNIYDEGQESSTEWGSNANGTYPIYKTPREGIFKRYYEIGQKGETLHVEVIGEDKCADHYAYLCTLPGVGETLVRLRDSGVSFPKSQIDHVAYFKYGYLLFITFEPAREAHDVFKRFAKVFEQTYTRFLDLQKAEAQAREAQIEAALERVRSRSMGMQKSDELREIIQVVYEQFIQLGFNINSAGFATDYMESDDFSCWFADSYSVFPNKVHIPYFDHPQFNRLKEAKEKGLEFYASRLTFEEKNKFFDHVLKHSPPVPQELKEVFYSAAGYITSHVLLKNVILYILNLTDIPFSEETNAILKRFGKVFEQTYTRFLDLQKAETQAREAQIEAALERVRSRSMAMHHSEELLQVITVVSEQLQNLNFKFNTVSFAINNQEHDYKFWFAPMGQATPSFIEVPYVSNPMFDRVKDVLASGGTFYSDTLTPEESKHWHEHVFAHADFSFLSEETKDYVLRSGYARSVAITRSIMLIVSNYAAKPFSDEQNNIIKRFAAVFEQSYTRFLDLQKAEAQAREAQIEASLEKVRSRSLAMHKSDELGFVVDELFQRLKELEIGFDSVNILQFTEDGFQIWAAYQPGKFTVTQIPYTKTDIPYVRQAVEAKRSGKRLFIHRYLFEEKNLFLKYLFEETHFINLPEERKQFLLQAPCYTVSIGFAKNTALQLQSYSRAAFSESDNALLMRFVNVFEQCYTRFLDLQKVEAQAREANIENALEKVRSRSLAMHKSSELQEVINTVFDRLTDLEIEADSAGIVIPREGTKDLIAWMQNAERTYSSAINLPFVEQSVIASDLQESIENVAELTNRIYTKAEKNQWFGYQFVHSDMKHIPAERKKLVLDAGGFTIAHARAPHGGIILNRYSDKKFSDKENDILKRFCKVFEQAYIRFLDLQKAEAQAREAQIEASLERVRSKTMAMHNSHDVGNTVATLFGEVTKLGVRTNRCGILIFSTSDDTEVWAARSNPSGEVNLIIGYLNVSLHPLLSSARNAWKNKQTTFSYEMIGEDLINYYQMINNQSSYPFRVNMEALPSKEIHTEFYFPDGAVFSFTPEPVAADDAQIFKRLAGVFGQTYRRYLDLQKAEAQAREAQIEVSLERVRSKAMAMHKSEDLTSAVAVVFDELEKLDLGMSRCGIGILSKEKRTGDIWTTSKSEGQNTVHVSGVESMDIHPLLQHAFDAWLRQEAFTYVLQGQDLADYYQAIQHANFLLPESQLMVKNAEMSEQHYHATTFQAGALYAFRENSFTDEAKNVMKRFANVFSLTYKRFQDIQNAEAQAREAQIEAALEKVRSRSLIMRESSEIKDVITVVLEKIQQLGIAVASRSAIIFEFERGHRVVTQWAASPVHPSAIGLLTPYIDNPILKDFWEARETSVEFYENAYAKEDKDSLFGYFEQLGMNMTEEAKELIFSGQFYSLAVCYEQNSAIGIATHTGKLLVQEEIDLLRRFARVYEQSYTRFLDLKKAEEQAKEATIEAALEKVRGKAMAMHNSNDLIATASLVFSELRKLGINSFRSGVGLLTKENSKAKLYSATTSTEGGDLSLVGWATLEGHVVLSEIYNTWLDNKDYFPVLKGELLTSYYEKINSNFTVPTAQSEGLEQYGCFLPFSEGTFYGWSEKPYTELEIRILHRFKAIIDLTFRRYMELQKSEANALEAIRQASLDRVRAEIASMRTTSDLDRITPLIWKELNTLNVPFVRCGVFIMDEPQQQMHSFLSTPEGKAIAAFHLPYDAPGNVGEILSHWQKNETYISHWDRTAFRELGEFLIRQGAIPTIEVYMNTIPGDGIYLHCLPFMQGMLYVGNTSELKEDEIHLIQSVADAFATAYARYEDFNKLEAAKQQVDKTLNDLKQTQNQLVISEKMASLGELTAGIAHEIQNPLNFVNNFSEVSNELLNEMHEEIEKGNFSEVKAITEDVRKNLEKILHHGKRADGIVKGMLQHSRTSSGVKEPTDINVLADEYLRLAFHGFRAKDKSFNVTTRTDFDESVGKINVVPQEIGRVVLNLITNAFYTVSEKKRQSGNVFEPTVTLKTKKQDDYVLISVIDNGNGISPKVLDKIFQPFFTTKPTGQGTGLGLSLSYDIVKAHGGELTVETKQGEGSEFTLSLSAQ